MTRHQRAASASGAIQSTISPACSSNPGPLLSPYSARNVRSMLGNPAYACRQTSSAPRRGTSWTPHRKTASHRGAEGPIRVDRGSQRHAGGHLRKTFRFRAGAAPRSEAASGGEAQARLPARRDRALRSLRRHDGGADVDGKAPPIPPPGLRRPTARPLPYALHPRAPPGRTPSFAISPRCSPRRRWYWPNWSTHRPWTGATATWPTRANCSRRSTSS